MPALGTLLLAGICNDLMLGEVEDHLFLEHIETPVDRTVVPGQPDPLIDEVTGCGFADDIRDAVCVPLLWGRGNPSL